MSHNDILFLHNHLMKVFFIFKYNIFTSTIIINTITTDLYNIFLQRKSITYLYLRVDEMTNLKNTENSITINIVKCRYIYI